MVNGKEQQSVHQRNISLHTTAHSPRTISSKQPSNHHTPHTSTPAISKPCIIAATPPGGRKNSATVTDSPPKRVVTDTLKSFGNTSVHSQPMSYGNPLSAFRPILRRPVSPSRSTPCFRTATAFHHTPIKLTRTSSDCQSRPVSGNTKRVAFKDEVTQFILPNSEVSDYQYPKNFQRIPSQKPKHSFLTQHSRRSFSQTSNQFIYGASQQRPLQNPKHFIHGDSQHSPFQNPKHLLSKDSQCSSSQNPKHFIQGDSHHSPSQNPKHFLSQGFQSSPSENPKHNITEDSQHFTSQNPKHIHTRDPWHSPSKKPESVHSHPSELPVRQCAPSGDTKPAIGTLHAGDPAELKKLEQMYKKKLKYLRSQLAGLQAKTGYQTQIVH